MRAFSYTGKTPEVKIPSNEHIAQVLKILEDQLVVLKELTQTRIFIQRGASIHEEHPRPAEPV
jgi:hypothetical protein